MKIVIVHHLNDAQHYLFGVPEERDLKKDDLLRQLQRPRKRA